jgi:CheY-like chemotaxis protein
MRPLRKVLIADDSRFGLMLLEELFEAYPVTLVRASDGEEALRLFIEHAPDLVVSDILMPRLDGLGLTRKIRALDAGAQPIVVLTTALTVRGDLRMEARRSGADMVLPKPLGPDALRSALESFFDLQPQTVRPGVDVQPPTTFTTQRVDREEVLVALRGPSPPAPVARPATPPQPAAPAPPVAKRPRPRTSSERDVETLLAEVLGDLSPKK